MRVAVNALWRATSPAGICKHAAALVRCLCAGVEVDRVYLLIGTWQEQYFRQALQLEHTKLVFRCIDVANRSYTRNLWYLYGLPNLVEELGADLLHLAFPIPLNRSPIAKPVVTTLHDLYPYDIPSNFGFPRVIGHRLLLKQCLQRSDWITCVSDFTLDRLDSLFGSGITGKATRIYNCVERSQFRIHRPALGYLEGRPFLLSVAQHRKNKNIELMLKGYAALLNEGLVTADTVLVIVGKTGPETRVIERTITTLGLQAQVGLVHGITDAELAWLYENTLLTFCTSTIEGFGLPVAEALQYGARVVCSDIPAFREVGRGDCTFFSLAGSNPIGDFVNACDCALRQAPSSVDHSSLFSAETVAAQYLNLYSCLVDSRLAQAA